MYNDGKICLDILQNQWSPIYDISAVLTSIQSLLSDPNPASPANAEASQLFERDRREYNKRVRAIVEESWIDDSSAIEASSAPDNSQADVPVVASATIFALGASTTNADAATIAPDDL